ncbi:MAG: VPDSG-CTERM sorting domain-containing protein [Opitutaceae bacterium]|nr:VPDSG-CTERM sorting domain-containing protein [Opitutaceae bacterium]
MLTAASSVLASFVVSVPDSGSTGFLLGAAILGAGFLARFLKNRKS